MKTTLPLVALWLLARPVAAYEFTQCSWRSTGQDTSGCPTGFKDVDSCGCGVSAAPKWFAGQLAMQVEDEAGNGVDAAQFLQVCREAAQAWSAVPCSSLLLDASQTFAANSDARWGNHNNIESEHGIFWVTSDSEWQRVTGAGAGGMLSASVSPWLRQGCDAAAFYDTDILINGFAATSWTSTHLKSVVMHEMGHALGLGHACLKGPVTGQCSNECPALMAASGADATAPQQDDIDGICALYPGAGGGIGVPCQGPSDCQSAPICVTHDGFSYCTHTCGTCEEGYACQNVDNQDVCVRKGLPAPGEECTGICAAGAFCVIDDGTPQTPIAHCYTACTPPSTAGCPANNRCVELIDGDGICWPEGTQQLGELCGTVQTGECANGLLCVSDDPINMTAHCYRECDETRPSSCGTGFLCYDVGSSSGVCLTAAAPGQVCEPPAADFTCEFGWQCTPPPDGGTTYVCNRSCTLLAPDSCGEGELCVTFVDSYNSPIVAACYPRGTAEEGEVCSSIADCAASLICVAVSPSRSECLVQCNPASPNCPHPGQTCEELGSEVFVCFTAGGTGTEDGGSGTMDAGEAWNPANYGQPCNNDDQCPGGACTSAHADSSDVCWKSCSSWAECTDLPYPPAPGGRIACEEISGSSAGRVCMLVSPQNGRCGNFINARCLGTGSYAGACLTDAPGLGTCVQFCDPDAVHSTTCNTVGLPPGSCGCQVKDGCSNWLQIGVSGQSQYDGLCAPTTSSGDPCGYDTATLLLTACTDGQECLGMTSGNPTGTCGPPVVDGGVIADAGAGSDAASACGALGVIGECAGDVVRWCAGGEIQTVDCSTDPSIGGPHSTCGLVDCDDQPYPGCFGFWCVAKLGESCADAACDVRLNHGCLEGLCAVSSSCEEASYVPTCTGSSATFCDHGVTSNRDCGADGEPYTCAIPPDATTSACVGLVGGECGSYAGIDYDCAAGLSCTRGICTAPDAGAPDGASLDGNIGTDAGIGDVSAVGDSSAGSDGASSDTGIASDAAATPDAAPVDGSGDGDTGVVADATGSDGLGGDVVTAGDRPGADADTGANAAEGCACSASRHRTSTTLVLVGVLGLVVFRRRRSRCCG